MVTKSSFFRLTRTKQDSYNQTVNIDCACSLADDNFVAVISVDCRNEASEGKCVRDQCVICPGEVDNCELYSFIVL